MRRFSCFHRRTQSILCKTLRKRYSIGGYERAVEVETPQDPMGGLSKFALIRAVLGFRWLLNYRDTNDLKEQP